MFVLFDFQAWDAAAEAVLCACSRRRRGARHFVASSELAEEFIDDGTHLGEVIRPGRLVIVDLRDEFMEKDQALGLFVVLLQLFAEVTFEGRKFNKLVVFDEAHKYIESPDLVAGLVEVVREMRHKGTSIMVLI